MKRKESIADTMMTGREATYLDSVVVRHLINMIVMLMVIAIICVSNYIGFALYPKLRNSLPLLPQLSLFHVSGPSYVSPIAGLLNQFVPEGFRDPAHWMDSGNGCLVYHPSPVGEGESVTWSGACADGFAHGKGTVVWSINGKEGQRDKVTLDHGLRNGTAILRFPDGTERHLMYDHGRKIEKK